MAKHIIAGILGLAVFIPLLSHAQTVSGKQLPSTDEILSRHHVQLNRESLIAHLEDPNETIRELVATKLGEDADKDAIPNLVAALATESSAQVRTQLGYALARRGDENGFVALNALCIDRTITPATRINAARATFAAASFSRHHDACHEVVFDVLEDRSDDPSSASARSSVLSLVPSYIQSGLSPDEKATLADLAIKSLNSKDSDERQSAAFALGRLHDPYTVAFLRRAVAGERNEAVRLTMQAAVDRLTKKRE